LRVVLDASAGLAVALGHEAAMPLLDHLESASLVVAPDLYATEVANGLWKYVAAGQVTLDEASERLAIAMKLPDRLVSSEALVQEALREASLRKHPVYDLCYAILARREGAAVITLDKRLRKLLQAMHVAVVS
jgi:predicted nucleic acid-binding protein